MKLIVFDNLQQVEYFDFLDVYNTVKIKTTNFCDFFLQTIL